MYMYIYIVLAIMLMLVVYLILNKYYDKKNNINNIQIINRNKSTQNLVKDVLKNKKKYLSEEEVKKLSNNVQFFDTSNDENITDKFINNKEIMPINEDNVVIQSINTNPSLNVILNKTQNKLNVLDVEMLKDENYLNNFYYDIFGNRIKETLKNYYVNFLTNIDNNNNVCQKVNIKRPDESNFIIPDQYPTLKYQTNAYNIDWNRIINPMVVY